MNIRYPDWRQDVLNALDTLAAEVPRTLHGHADPRSPDLTNAIHWLIDDTWWDHRAPADSIGVILRNDAEARAVTAVITEIDQVAKRQGASSTGREWFSDERWPFVRRLAADAASLFRSP